MGVCFLHGLNVFTVDFKHNIIMDTDYGYPVFAKHNISTFRLTSDITTERETAVPTRTKVSSDKETNVEAIREKRYVTMLCLSISLIVLDY